MFFFNNDIILNNVNLLKFFLIKFYKITEIVEKFIRGYSLVLSFILLKLFCWKENIVKYSISSLSCNICLRNNIKFDGKNCY